MGHGSIHQVHRSRRGPRIDTLARVSPCGGTCPTVANDPKVVLHPIVANVLAQPRYPPVSMYLVASCTQVTGMAAIASKTEFVLLVRFFCAAQPASR